MQVILMEKVANLGNLGDVVKVKDGYARNFLIPHGKAKRATPDRVGSGAQSVATTAQKNPLPFAVGAAFLGGVAVGWILRR